LGPHVVVGGAQGILERLGCRVRHGSVEFLMESDIIAIMGPLSALRLTQVVLYAVLVPKRHYKPSTDTGKSRERFPVRIFRWSASTHLG
jgi:hypothetical protein